MSVEALSYVFNHSPYKGTALVIHLAIADSVSDQNDNEFWMRQGKLAEKAKTSRETVNRTVHQMVNDGVLRFVNQNERGVNRYELVLREGVMNDHKPVTNDHSGSDDSSQGVCDLVTLDVTDNHTQPKVTQLVTQTDKTLDHFGFSMFWHAYPRKVGKGAAEKAWKAAVKKAPPDLIIDRAMAYQDFRRGEDPQFTAHPATWLNQERWTDEPDAPAVPKYAAGIAEWVSEYENSNGATREIG